MTSILLTEQNDIEFKQRLSEFNSEYAIGFTSTIFNDKMVEEDYQNFMKDYYSNSLKITCISLLLYELLSFLLISIFASKKFFDTFPFLLYIQLTFIIIGIACVFLLNFLMKSNKVKLWLKYILHYTFIAYNICIICSIRYSYVMNKEHLVAIIFFSFNFFCSISYLTILETSKLDPLLLGIIDIITMTILNFIKYDDKEQSIEYVVEITAGFLVYLIYFKKETDMILSRQTYIGIKKLEKTHLYYSKFINEIDFQMCSFIDLKPIFSNIAFSANINNLNSFNSNENELLISKYLEKLYQNDTNIPLMNILKEYSNTDNHIGLNKNSFIQLGQFYSLKQNGKNFFHIQIRKFPIRHNKYLIDLILKDITKTLENERISVETQLKKKVFSKLAHEFKTPLIILSNELNDLTTSLNLFLPNDVKYKCEVFIHISDYTLFLIDDLIQYSTNFQNMVVNMEENVNLEEIIIFCFKALISYKSYLPGNKNVIKTSMYYDPIIDNYSIRTDRIRLKQIIINLLSNAIKFTKTGTITIKALVENDIVKIEIEDTGCGMNTTELNMVNIIDPDIRINIEQNYNFMGTGIGISICKLIVSLLNNHSLYFISEKLVGTKVILSIKPDIKSVSLIQQPTKGRNKSNSRISIYEESKLTLSKHEIDFVNYSLLYEDKLLKYNSLNIISSNSFNIINDTKVKTNDSLPYIFIVDDSESLRKSVYNMITKWEKQNEYNINLLNDGIDLLHMITVAQEKGNRIGLILIDENMVFLNGSETIRIIRHLEAFEKIRRNIIISLTAFSDKETSELIKNAGADEVYIKPIKKDSLYNLLDKTLV